MEHQSIERIARRYRDEGYDVIVHPQGDQIPPFLAGFPLDMLATRGNEGVVVEVKTKRIDLSSDPSAARLAEIVNAQPGWRLDLVVLEAETQVERAAQEASEPSDEQLDQILKTADELTEKGYAPYACVVAWSGLEAAMRRVRAEGELYGKTTATELMRTIYGNGILSREQFDKLRESYKIRTQVVHGLVPSQIDPDLIPYLTATARYLLYGNQAAVQTN
jgi:hypothetical protein